MSLSKYRDLAKEERRAAAAKRAERRKLWFEVKDPELQSILEVAHAISQRLFAAGAVDSYRVIHDALETIEDHGNTWWRALDAITQEVGVAGEITGLHKECSVISDVLYIYVYEDPSDPKSNLERLCNEMCAACYAESR